MEEIIVDGEIEEITPVEETVVPAEEVTETVAPAEEVAPTVEVAE